ncbi:MAG: transcriptional repressor [Deltaproteobacteria bacterium]|nr:transcriptional repressor [Deltaproteobacteria bacterium]
MKASKTRRKIMKMFFTLEEHVSVDELFRKVREQNPGIGYATVYRTLRTLEELGYASSIEIGDGKKRFENGMAMHHDHICCLVCKKITEFSDPEIEILQKIIADKHDFKIIDHSLYIFGICLDCRK